MHSAKERSARTSSIAASDCGGLGGGSLAGLACGLVALVMSSSKKKTANKKNCGISATSSKRAAKRVRSVSMSVDLEGNRPGLYHTRSWEGRYRTTSASECLERYLREDRQRFDMAALAAGKLGTMREVFPIQSLPWELKLKIFTFLSPKERGAAAQVCSEWNTIIKTARLWNSVDLTRFPLCPIKRRNHECTQLCYNNYRNQIKKFLKFLQSVRPVLRILNFAYDIGDYEDGWLDTMSAFLQSSRLHELQVARLNWKETPVKPFWGESITWSTNDYKELMFRHRHRQRLFVNFFDRFTASAPNVTKLILPFDWSPRSLKSLGRLHNLHSLVLEKYFVFQTLNQSSIDQLFRVCPRLDKLILEIWTPGGNGPQLYSIRSSSLQYLDISQCRGFCLEEVDLPLVQVIKVSRYRLNGPLISVDNGTIPCIYDILVNGARALRQLNEHTLQPEWSNCIYPELETILYAVCSCRKHKSGWAK